MCGIVGCAGNLIQKHNKIFRDMLFMDVIRGVDSTGVMLVNMKGEVQVEKALGTPNNLWDWGASKLFDFRGVGKSVSRIMLGHNRAATAGKVIEDNAHPFTFENITGVHNGTLTSYYELKDSNSFDVDSQALFNDIAANGVEHTWKSFHGAAAVVFYDKISGNLNFIRNSQRPLFMATNKRKDVIFWASEMWMIDAACGRNGEEVFREWGEDGKLTDNPANPTSLALDHLYTFEVTNSAYTLVSREKLEKKPHAISGGQITRTGGTNTSVNNRHGKGTIPTVIGGGKKSTQINPDWAKNTVRLGKETRGLKFKLISETVGGGLLGRLSDSQEFITVIPNNELSRNKLRDLLGKPHEFITNARMRDKKVGKYSNYRISSANVRLIASPVQTPVRKEKEQVGGPYKGYRGELLNYEDWNAQFKKNPSGCSCSWCSDNLYAQDSHLYKFISSGEALCEDCSNNPDVIGQAAGYV
ncbi:MAG: hypothetical protein CMN30_31855 [Sandaracinus sp.]|nr:hypothetical protein [Sandaracinus sp.]